MQRTKKRERERRHAITSIMITMYDHHSKSGETKSGPNLELHTLLRFLIYSFLQQRTIKNLLNSIDNNPNRNWDTKIPETIRTLCSQKMAGNPIQKVYKLIIQSKTFLEFGRGNKRNAYVYVINLLRSYSNKINRTLENNYKILCYMTSKIKKIIS